MAADDTEVVRLRALLEGERAGRIRAERALRDLLTTRPPPPVASGGDAAAPAGSYVVVPIGTVHSPFPDRRGAPRQPLLAPHVRAVLELNSTVPGEALDGLEGFSHVWLTWLFSDNTLSTRAATARQPTVWGRLGRTWSTKVSPPGLYGGRTGVLATRSPHRPNALGLSLVPVRGVDVARRRLLLGACDLCDGTPVVDVKPAAPYDCAACLGGMPIVRGGWPYRRALADTPPLPCPPPQAADMQDALAPLPPPASEAIAIAAPVSASSVDATVDAAFHVRAPLWVTQPLAEERTRVEFTAAALGALRAACSAGRCRLYGVGSRGGGGEAASRGEAATGASKRQRRQSSGPPLRQLAPPDSEEVALAEAEAAELAAAVAEVVSLDIRGVHQGRGGAGEGAAVVGSGMRAIDEPAPPVEDSGSQIPAQSSAPYELRFDTLRVVFTARRCDVAMPSEKRLHSGGAGTGSTPVGAAPRHCWFCIESVEVWQEGDSRTLPPSMLADSPEPLEASLEDAGLMQVPASDAATAVPKLAETACTGSLTRS